MKTICVIPSRYASNRLPGKALALIAGKPMVRWVYEQASKAENIDRVIVATDHNKIKAVVESFSGNVKMTDPELPSGTDRVYAAIKNEVADIVINLQGDEPFVSPRLLNELVSTFEDEQIKIATPICRINDSEDLFNPNVVKVIQDKNGFALLFSRSVIPYVREEENEEKWHLNHTFYKHIGIYAYRKSCLKELISLQESKLEKTEKLEQLRFLENGYKIHTLLTDYDSLSVDTEEDLKKANKLANKMNNK